LINFASGRQTPLNEKSKLMIQRIQSLYLAVAVVCFCLLFFFPVAIYHHEVQGTYQLFVTGMKYVDQQTTINFWATFPMVLLTGIALLLSAASIFLFKKRKLQLLLVNLSILFTIVLVALIFLFYADHLFKDIVKVLPSYQFGGFIPLISLVFLILSFRAIRKDDNLVKSTERLR
jgi:hypothetical protein